ncbi:MAG TPA: peptidoglycan DD-metalloendopeptidase family protein [Sphingomicrobium sp.]|nr:peptidoglycan DD-metalloendopeptidase family protein [Sphingomicrobium sp.]
MRAAIPVLLLSLGLAGSGLAQQAAAPIQSALQKARADQAAAEAETARLEKVASQARSEAERLHAEQAAAAQAIEAAEARITAADAKFKLASASVAAHRRRLAEEQRPVSSLLAGLATMARRPPILALADGSSTDELVKLRILIDSTLPVIRRRTAGLSAELAKGRRLEQAALAARGETLRSRRNLESRQAQFASLERKSIQRALAAGGKALSAGDVAIAAGEDVQRLKREQSDSRSARALAAELMALGPAPARPFAPDQARRQVSIRYRLPVVAPVTDGLAAVDDSGVRSRGITLATSRGTPLAAPANGVVRFAGPFRDYDGILIIDHGGGWMSLIVNVSSTLKPGEKVQMGAPIGRALGPVEVELSQNGRRFSPALIAGSSQSLSNASKGG